MLMKMDLLFILSLLNLHEPACKATFDVKLNVPGGKTALSNMNQTNEEKLRKVFRLKFL